MRNLKFLTTGLMLAGFALLVSWPWTVGSRPSTKQALKEYVLRSGIYFSSLLIIFFAATVCAWLIVRKQRVEFREQSRKNLDELIKGTLKDHERKDA